MAHTMERYDIYDDIDVVKRIKIQRLRWIAPTQFVGFSNLTYFFKDAANRENDERYRELISNVFLPKMKAWLEWHVVSTARVTMVLLRGEFGEHFISRSRPANWPLRSCDLTPLHYFLWGYIKVHVFTDKPAYIDALEDNIEAFIREIPAEMLD